nr:GFA family protein [Rhizobium indicum]
MCHCADCRQASGSAFTYFACRAPFPKRRRPSP